MSRYCIPDSDGKVVDEANVGSTNAARKQTLGQIKKCRIALEVGTHSPWVSRSLKAMGHEVIVADPRQLKLISESSRKDDRLDPKLLRPIRHRGEGAQMDLMGIRARAGCDADQMGVEKASELPKGLQEVLRPLLEQVEALTAAIKECDRKLEQIAKASSAAGTWAVMWA